MDAVQNKFSGAQKAAEQFAGATQNVSKAAESAGKGAEKASKGLGQFATSIGRIFKYRMIRSVIREIGQAFKEGLQNAYQFSKGIGGDLAKALDTLSTKSLTMKNQMGAAFGALLQAVMPVLLKIIELATKAANAITMLLSALSGSGTYLHAIDSAQDWAKATASGAKAAKEWRRQLMGFDEINRLNAPSSGGGGGGGAGVDFSKMFEELELPEWLVNLGERLKELIPILGTIAAIIGGISLLRHIGEVLGWGEAFQGVLTKLTGIALTIAGAILLCDGFADAIMNGVDWGNLIEMIAGTALVVMGLFTAFGKTAGAIGLLIAGVALVIAGFKTWITTGEASVPVLTSISVGFLAIGGAIALLTGSWIPLIIAAVGALVVWVVGKWDWIKTKWNEMWSNIVGTLAGWANNILAILHPILAAIDAIVSFFGGSSNLGGFSFPTFATGGFPEDGLFMANHSELVGQFSNGSTAVANNSQIVEGIKRGVYEAVSSAMGNSGGELVANVYLDGKQISRSVTRQQRNTSRATGVAIG